MFEEFLLGVATGFLSPYIVKYLIYPKLKDFIKERWNSEDEIETNSKRHGRGRPLGSKNKPKEKK
jgi:hypothetical protein